MSAIIRNDAYHRGQLFERYRARLHRLAARALDAQMRARVGASDIVQETLLDAERGFRQFAGSTVAELEAWLLAIHRRCLVRHALKHTAKKRHPRKEVNIDLSPLASTFLPTEATDPNGTPSVCLMKKESAGVMVRLLDQLPAAQNAAIRLCYLQGRSVSETALILRRSRSATEGLLKRGLKTLREKLCGCAATR